MTQQTNRTVEIPAEAWALADRPYTVTVSHDPDNGYIAEVAEMPAVVVAEATEDALRDSLRTAMALHITTRLRRGLPVPEPRSVLV